MHPTEVTSYCWPHHARIEGAGSCRRTTCSTATDNRQYVLTCRCVSAGGFWRPFGHYQGRLGALVTISHRDTDTVFIDELRKTCESTNINFLLGAGCSMPEFGTLGNIETLWAQLKTSETKERIANEHGDHANLIENLIEASLKASFFETAILPNRDYIKTNTEETKENYELFCRAAMKLVAKREASTLPKQVTFFVSNYDICMDVALDMARIPTNSGYVGRFNPLVDLSDFGRRVTTSTLTLGYQSEIASANLVKIHGCASWRKKGGGIEFSNEFDLIEEIERNIDNLCQTAQQANPTQDPGLQGGLFPLNSNTFNELIEQATAHAHKFDSDSVNKLLESFKKLQIVWPTKQKFHDTVLDEIYYAQLRRLTNQLEVRNSVLIVAGFSFADEHIRKLILRAADTNPTLKVIILCYNEQSERDIKENLLSECNTIPNDNVTTVTAMKPGTGHIQGNLDLNTVSTLLEMVSK